MSEPVAVKESEKVEYAIEYDYLTLDVMGNWSVPEARVLSKGSDPGYLRRALERPDTWVEFGRLFEGIYGYRYENPRMVRLVTKKVTTKRVVGIPKGKERK